MDRSHRPPRWSAFIAVWGVAIAVLAAAACDDGGPASPALPSATTVHEGSFEVSFEWTMAPRLTTRDGKPAFPRSVDLTPEYVNPRGWEVDLKACDRKGNVAQLTWEAPGAELLEEGARSDECFSARARFTQAGQSDVVIHVRDRDGGSADLRQAVAPRDILFVSLGDSVASGEGNPDEPAAGAAPPGWNDLRCHRSVKAGPALAALQLEEADPHSSVTFVHLACSGATIAAGLLGPYRGIDRTTGYRADLSPQVDEMRRLLGPRKADIVTLSIGANDIGFSSILITCKSPTVVDCQHDLLRSGPFPTYEDAVSARIQALDYGRLAEALSPLVATPRSVLLTEYFDPIHADSKTVCGERGAPELLSDYDPKLFRDPLITQVGRATKVTGSEARWAYDGVLSPLNRVLEDAARASGWTFVGGIAEAFASHGYCANEHWVVRYTESQAAQLNDTGTLHPNGKGQELYGRRIAEVARTVLER